MFARTTVCNCNFFHINKKSHDWPDLTSFQHDVREGLRLREWKAAAKRRRDMAEISGGIQREVTTALHSEKDQLTEYQRACVRAIVCCGVHTAGRHTLHVTRGHDTGVCPHCGSEDGESVFHRWWVCPAWQSLRSSTLSLLPADPSEMPTCLAECGILPCGEQFSRWSGLVTHIQRMMMQILCVCCDHIKSTAAKAAAAPPQPPSSSNADDVPVGLRHQLVQMPDNKWKCTTCGRVAAAHLRARLVTSTCRGVNLAAEGTTPVADSKNRSLQAKLHEEWAANKPGGHDFFWDGNGQGTVSCRLCSKKWPYAFKNWRKQILVKCSGSRDAEDQRRATLRQQLLAFDTTHSLALDAATDYVMCSTCRGNKHPKEWKSFARTQCPGQKPDDEALSGPKRKAELRDRFMKKRGRSAPSAPD